MVKYTREQRLRTVRLYERYDCSAAAVTDELGYPSRGMLAQWHRAWVEAGRDDGRSLDDGSEERYTPEQKRAAADHYLRHGRCLRRTLRALGYPSHEVLARWVDELESGRRRLRRAPVDEATRRRAVARYACGEAISRRIGEELGVSADVVRNRQHTMLSHDDKEHGMHDEDARRAPEPVREDPVPASGAGRPIGDMRREDPSGTASGRHVRHAAEGPVGPVRPFAQHVLPQPPTTRPARKGRIAGRIGHGRVQAKPETLRLPAHIWQMLHERGIRVRARRIMRVMSAHGITPRLKSRRRYNSYSGEHSLTPANIVKRLFQAKAPNRLWVITEFRIGEGKIYLSPVIDCYDGMPVAWSIGTSPTAKLADTMLEHACATLKDGEYPVIHSERGCHCRWSGWIRIRERHGLTRSMSARGCSPDNTAAEGFFGRLKQEFYHNRDHQDDSIDEFIDALEWYRDECIKTEYGMSIRRHGQELGLMA